MLLQTSRLAERLTKKAFVGALARGLGRFGLKATGKTLGAMGRTAVKHPMGTLAAVGGTAAGLGEAIPGIKRSEKAFRKMRAGYRGVPSPIRPEMGIRRFR
jgi:hypothetical protein